VLFVATTNFADAVDEAFLSRADLVVTLELPDTPTIARIIGTALPSCRCCAGSRPAGLRRSPARQTRDACAGLDGRGCANSCCRADTAARGDTRPDRLTADDLFAAMDEDSPRGAHMTDTGRLPMIHFDYRSRPVVFDMLEAYREPIEAAGSLRRPRG